MEALQNYLCDNSEYLSKDKHYNEMFGNILSYLINDKKKDKYGAINHFCNNRIDKLYKTHNPISVIKITDEEWNVDLKKYIDKEDCDTFIRKLSQIVLDNNEKLSSVRFIFPKCLSKYQRQIIHIMQIKGKYSSFTPIYENENGVEHRLNIFKSF